MKLEDYLEKRRLLKEGEESFRKTCPKCNFALKTCYCAEIKRFDPKITFVILIHRLEIDRKIATGRMASLIMENAILLRGHDYSENLTVNTLLSDPQNLCFVLFPGKESLNLSTLSFEEKQSSFPLDKKLVIFVVDGTWATARQTMRLSGNLNKLPRISFDSKRKSNFRVRKQPKAECLSTLEAIHETIELLGVARGVDMKARPHDNLLHVFNFMVEKQLKFLSGS